MATHAMQYICNHGNPCNATHAMQPMQCNPCNATHAMQPMQCNPCNAAHATHMHDNTHAMQYICNPGNPCIATHAVQPMHYKWLMPLASQYLLLVLCNVQA